ncbi:hypothetical protein [Bacteroides sp. UBA939]|uniref:hypothetical protein n=1 Tax=Bacteroides sp. UBA939 TaxID=1946092 RepID=UPI0025B870D2|nr:hypothetical protein [Bacteroides sp. UBA939]
MNHLISHNSPKCKLRFFAGILFCFLLSLQYGMAQDVPKKLGKYDVPKGRWNLVFTNDIAYNQWNYIPSHETWDSSYMLMFGVGAGLEYAYCRNRTLILTAETGVTGYAFTMEPSEWSHLTQYYNINLLHTFYWKHFRVGIGPTLGWNNWQYIYREEYDPEVEMIDDEQENNEQEPHYGKFGKDDFSFTRFAAGADIQIYYYIIPRLGFGAEYSARWMWKEGAKGKCDHHWALKAQLKFRLSKKKRHYQ